MWGGGGFLNPKGNDHKYVCVCVCVCVCKTSLISSGLQLQAAGEEAGIFQMGQWDDDECNAAKTKQFRFAEAGA